MKTLYLAKEPGTGVRNDLSRISGEVIVVDCLNAYGDYYRKRGYNCISRTEFFALEDMKFDVIIGNPPYQAPKGDKKGKGGNNSLYIKFIERAVELAAPGATISLVTPPAALIKSTVIRQPSPTLENLVSEGNLKMVDLTAKQHFPGIGCPICRWVFTKGEEQGPVRVISESGSADFSLEKVYYLPPTFEQVEVDLYNKLVSNTEGEVLKITRSQKRIDGTINTFGYPKVQFGGEGRLNFHKKDYEFLTSQLCLWLFDYTRRHDQQINHRAIHTLVVPTDGFKLTQAEQDFIDSRHWVNFSKKEG